MKKTGEIGLLAFGSNLGDRRNTLIGARKALERGGDVTLRRCSRLFQSPAQGGPPGQPRFLNAVVEIETVLTPEELLTRCWSIEREFGRERHERWGPRTVDIDILAYGVRVSRNPRLILPHPRLHLRSFVLLPLLEVAPDWIHPLLGKTISQLAAGLRDEEGIQPLGEAW